MAIQVNFYNDETGIQLPNAYVKISTLSIDKIRIHATILIYYDKQSRDSGKKPIITQFYNGLYSDYQKQELSILSFVYSQMKNMSTFSSSVDC